MFLVLSLLLLTQSPDGDLLIADFEGDSYGPWKVTGTAFGNQPARGTLPGQMEVTGFLGKGLVNSFAGGDTSTGTLTSPAIKIERKYINFLVGGGKHPEKTCINLLLDGKVVRTATGPNGQPGGSEQLDWHSWDVSDLLGKTVVIEIVDQHTGGWGHINVDHIVQSQVRKGVVENQGRFMELSHRYLLLPVKNKGRKRVVRVLQQAEIVRTLDINLADSEPDWWACIDVAALPGKHILVLVDQLPGDSKALQLIHGSDEWKTDVPFYQEKYRPQFHFSSKRGWLNDPNGLVYHRGKYHLFYQHNPYGWDWGNMHWGHAVSSDLLHWKEEPIAIYPRRYGDWAFSGSAVVDTQNTSGWGSEKEPAMVAAYTSTDRGECIIYSVDQGKSWKEYDKNPVLKHQGRDPRLFWHEPTKAWIMAVYDEADRSRNISFHSSSNLKDWKFESRIYGFYECPDMYELPVAGQAGQKRWILSGASQDYLVGAFDGKTFTHESTMQKGHYGKGYYAAQTFSQTPDGRRIILFWMQATSPGMAFNQAMSIPWEVSLQQTGQGLKLCYQPVKEMESLRTKSHDLSKGAVQAGAAEIELEIIPQQGETIQLMIGKVKVEYDAKVNELRCSGMKATVPLVDGKFTLRAFVDRTSLEMVAGQGDVLMPLPHLFGDKPSEIQLKAKGDVKVARVYDLGSVWK